MPILPPEPSAENSPTASPEGAARGPAKMLRAPAQGGAILYDPSRAGNVTAELFDSEYWRLRQQASRPTAGRGDAWFIEDGARRWVLRHYRRGGWMARLMRDRYWWVGEERTRPFAEWRLMFELHAAGLPVPAPVAARYRRHGLFYSADLLTERLADAEPLSARLQRAPLPAAVWERIGHCIHRFHAAGVFHADLNAHNILLTSADAVYLIDFDRGERRPAGEWQAANLARLRRSLDKINPGLPSGRFGEQDWRALQAAYLNKETQTK